MDDRVPTVCMVSPKLLAGAAFPTTVQLLKPNIQVQLYLTQHVHDHARFARTHPEVTDIAFGLLLYIFTGFPRGFPKLLAGAAFPTPKANMQTQLYLCSI